jgi:tetratricopeptide (TPR) repeat protein
MPNYPTTIRKTNSWWIILGICAVLAAITWLVFGQTLGHQFINYDDSTYLYGNSTVRNGISGHGIAWAFTHVHSQNWHPITSISHMLDCQLFGLNPSGHHFTNVFLQTIAVVLLFLVLWQMTGALWASAFAAAVFASHPLRVESVAWVAERKDLLSGVFFMLTLAAYTRYVRHPSTARYMIVSVLFACGLMSKPMLITVPVVLLLLDYWPLGRLSNGKTTILGAFRRLVAEKIPLFLLSIGSGVATVLAQNYALGSTENLPVKMRITNAVISYVDYVRQMLWPNDLVPFYVHPENRLEFWRLAAAATALVVITAIAFVQRRKRPYLIVGWLWYIVMFVPVIGFIQVGLQGHADRYTYLPQIGLYIAITWLVWEITASWRLRPVILAPLAAIIVVTLSILSWKQTTHWHDTESLWRYTLSAGPESDVAHTGLAGILVVHGQIDEAVSHYRIALELRDGNAAAHHGLAIALAQQRKVDEAIEHWKKALSIQPDNAEASNYLGVMFIHKGETDNAIAQWRQTLAFDPDNGDAAQNLAWVLATSADANLRDGREAVELAQRAVRLPGRNTAIVLRTLAAALAENNQFEEAVATAERAQRLAEAAGDNAMAENLRQCAELFRQGKPLHGSVPNQGHSLILPLADSPPN